MIFSLRFSCRLPCYGAIRFFRHFYATRFDSAAVRVYCHFHTFSLICRYDAIIFCITPLIRHASDAAAVMKFMPRYATPRYILLCFR